MDTINIDHISLSERGMRVLETLQADNGTAAFYDRHLSRLFHMVLHSYDMLGMDALEALDTLCTLDTLRHDLRHLSGASAPGGEGEAPDEGPEESGDATQVMQV